MRQKNIHECFVIPARLGMGASVGPPRRAQSIHQMPFKLSWFAEQFLILSTTSSKQRYAKGI